MCSQRLITALMVSLLSIPDVDACTRAPPQSPPVSIVIKKVTADQIVFCIVFHNFTTMASDSGNFCACGLGLPAEYEDVEITSVEIVDSATQEKIDEFSFEPNENTAAGYNDLVQTGNWTGFLAQIDVPVPDALNVDLAFNASFQILSTGFKRGDYDADGCVDKDDSDLLTDFIFRGAAPRRCLETADTNDDGIIDIRDIVFLMRYLEEDDAPPLPRPRHVRPGSHAGSSHRV